MAYQNIMKQFNILIIDNNPGDRAYFEEALRLNGYLVKTAGSGKNGLEILKKEPFDLIFIDVGLPGRESFQTCQMVKADPSFRRTPVLFMVGGGALVFLKEVYGSGGDDYIVKPLVLGELLMKARIHIELKYSREMAKNMNKILESKVAQRTHELEDSLQKLDKAKKELEMLSVAKSEFLNLISHEIRTPLNGILGSLALIGRYRFTDEVNRYFSLLDISVKRLEKFSYTILEASMLRLKGEKALIFVEVDMVNVVNEALELCKEKFSEKALKIVLQNEAVNTKIRGDQKYLLKCFTAVLDNAFKFSPKMGKVVVSFDKSTDGSLKIIIIDYGKGFSSSALNNIFRPLSNHEGHFDKNTGMGLHLAKTIVDAHSGIMTVRNNEPTGATVEILLPTSH